MIYGLTFARFLGLVRLTEKVRAEEVKERFILAAFVGWQMGAGGKKSFGEYLRGLHLADEPPRSKKSSTTKQATQDARLESMGIVKQKENKG